MGPTPDRYREDGLDARREDEEWERHKEAVAYAQEQDRLADLDYEEAVAQNMSDEER